MKMRLKSNFNSFIFNLALVKISYILYLSCNSPISVHATITGGNLPWWCIDIWP